MLTSKAPIVDSLPTSTAKMPKNDTVKYLQVVIDLVMYFDKPLWRAEIFVCTFSQPFYHQTGSTRLCFEYITDPSHTLC